MHRLPVPPRAPPPPARAPSPLERWQRRTMWAVLTLLAGSGALWLVFHHFLRVATEFGERPHALEVWWLRLHGLAAMLALLALGALAATHVRRALRQHRNRRSGLALGLLLGALVGSGYALYYFGGEETRPVISLVHWTVGLAVVAMLLAHGWLGRARGARPGRPR
ncbi:MAG: DUF4405 domain-containing protein [Proteobacteria bacterium]|nr:DUF4405 domain-containing protein [Pseudomonadota bacterium]